MKRGIIAVLAALSCMLCLAAGADTLYLPDGLIAIEEQAFYGDTSIDEVVLGDNTRFIGAQAFAGSSVTCVVLPDGIQSIAEDAFEGCEEVVFDCSEGSVAWQYAESHENIVNGLPFPGPGPETAASYFSYKANKDGKTCTITKFKGGVANVVIPKKLGSYKVTAIGSNAFLNVKNLQTVYVPEGVTTLAGSVFWNSSVESVYLPDTLTKLGESAFEGCTNLKAVRLPEGLKAILAHAFWECGSLTRITIPQSVTEIWDRAFAGCSSLRRIRLPEGLKFVDICAFSGCKSLTEIVIPAGVQRLESEAFRGCNNLKRVTLQEGLKAIGDYAFGECQGIKEVNFPSSLTTVEKDAFAHCRSVKFNLPDNISSIGEWAFGGTYLYCSYGSVTAKALNKAGYAFHCEDQPDFGVEVIVEDGEEKIVLSQYCGTDTEITIPTTVAGHKVKALKRMEFNDQITSVYIPDGIELRGTGNFSDAHGLTTVRLPADLKHITDYAFSNCWQLTQITLPQTLQTIGDYGFNNTRFTSVTLPEGLLSIGDFALSARLTSIILPEGLESIGKYAFSDATFEEITLPNSVKQVTGSIFGGCDNLSRVIVRDDNPYYAFKDGILYSRDGKTLVYCPRTRSGKVEVAAGTTVISDGAFSGCQQIRGLTLPDGLLSIGQGAMYGMNLTSLNIPDSVQTIGASAFILSSIHAIHLPASLKECAWDMLSHNDMTLLVVPDLVTSIDDFAFSNCSSLTALYLPDNITRVANTIVLGSDKCVLYCRKGSKTETALKQVGLPYSYYTHTGLIVEEGTDEYGGNGMIVTGYIGYDKEVVIPAKVNGIPVRAIGEGAFTRNYLLERVVLPEGLTTIRNEAFYVCRNLREVVLPSTLISVGEWAFSNCIALEEFVLPDSVVVVGNKMLASCLGLKRLTLSDGMQSFYPDMFTGCPELNYLKIPNTIKAFYSYTFREFQNLKTVALGDYVKEIVDDPVLPVAGLTFVCHPYTLTEKTLRDSGCAYEYYPGEASDFLWSVHEDALGNGEVTIDRFIGAAASTEIPAQIADMHVTAIGARAFAGSSVSEIAVPGSVNVFAEDAFAGCAGITFVCPMGCSAWEYAEAHEGITVRAPLPEVGPETDASFFTFRYDREDKNYSITGFKGGVADLVIPAEYKGYPVALINSQIFEGDPDLRTVYIPASVTYISWSAFRNCPNLESVYVGGWAEYSLNAFADNSKLKTVVLTGGCLYRSAFDNCTALANVTILDGERGTSFEANPFTGCTSLTFLALPDKALSVEFADLNEESSLLKVSVSDDNSDYSVRDGILYSKDGTKLVLYPAGRQGIVNIEEGVTEICDNAFAHCEGITEVRFPDTLKKIGNRAFAYSAVGEVVIPDSVTELGEGAFLECRELISVKLPKGITAIPDRLFYGQSGLRTIWIPDNVTSIGYLSFYSDKSTLRTAILPDSLESIHPLSFSGSTYRYCRPGTRAEQTMRSETIHFGITDGNGYAYRYVTADDGSKALTLDSYAGTNRELVIPGEVNGIPVISISYDAFSSMLHQSVRESFTSLVISEGVQRIEPMAFCGLRGLTSVSMPSTLKYIGSDAFSDCASLTHITVPSGVTFIGSHAFQNNPSLVSLELPNTVTEMQSGVVWNCTSLPSLRIPANITDFDMGDYPGCISLRDIYLPDNISQVRYRYGLDNVTYHCAFGSVTAEKFAGYRVAYSNCEGLEDFAFRIEREEDGTRYISITGYTGSAAVATLPGEVAGIPVRELALSLNSDCSELTELILPDGIKHVWPPMYGNSFVMRCNPDSDTETTLGSCGHKLAYSNCPAAKDFLFRGMSYDGFMVLAVVDYLGKEAVPALPGMIGTHPVEWIDSEVMEKVSSFALGDDFTSLNVMGEREKLTLYCNAGTSTEQMMCKFGYTFRYLDHPEVKDLVFRGKTQNDRAVIEMVGYLGNETVITVPGKIGEMPVTDIKDEGLDNVTALILGDDFTSIWTNVDRDRVTLYCRANTTTMEALFPMGYSFRLTDVPTAQDFLLKPCIGDEGNYFEIRKYFGAETEITIPGQIAGLKVKDIGSAVTEKVTSIILTDDFTSLYIGGDRASVMLYCNSGTSTERMMCDWGYSFRYLDRPDLKDFVFKGYSRSEGGVAFQMVNYLGNETVLTIPGKIGDIPITDVHDQGLDNVTALILGDDFVGFWTNVDQTRVTLCCHANTSTMGSLCYMGYYFRLTDVPAAQDLLLHLIEDSWGNRYFEIVGYLGTAKEINIPSQIAGVKVKDIGSAVTEKATRIILDDNFNDIWIGGDHSTFTICCHAGSATEAALRAREYSYEYLN